MSETASPRIHPILDFLDEKVNHKSKNVSIPQNFKLLTYMIQDQQFVVYEIQAYFKGQMWIFQCRYSCLADLHHKLKEERQYYSKFPAKQLFGNFRSAFIIRRGEALVKYLNEISNNYTADSQIFQKFIAQQQLNVIVEDLLREDNFNLDD